MTRPSATGETPFRFSRLLPEESLHSLNADRLATRLRGLQRVTDAALAEPSCCRLLPTLLERIRSVLGTDTASVPLLSEHGGGLETRASLGLDGETEPSAAIPLHSGVLGQVVRGRRALIVDDAAALKPLDRGLDGVRSMMLAPLMVDGEFLGVIHVGSMDGRWFEDAELEVLQAAADRVSLAVRNASIHERLKRELEERAELEARRAEAESHFRMMVESVVDYAIYFLDTAGNVNRWSPGAEHLTGYRAEEIIGRHLSTFYPPEVRGKGLAEREMRVASEAGRCEDEGWRLRKDGTRFWASVALSAVRDPTGELVGFTKVVHDLTERRNHEEQRERVLLREREARDAAEAANRVKSDFLAVMSHELRTPLTAILGYADLLLAGIPEAIGQGTRSQVERIDSSARALLAIIEEILDYVNLEAGEAPLHLRRVDLRDVARESLDRIRRLADEKGLRLSAQLPEEPLTAYTEPVRVRQIIVQLLSNAVKFTSHGTVSLEGARTPGGGVEFRVTDTGIGISDVNLDRVFEPFWQVEQSSTRNFGGTGMGLALARRTAERIGGSLVAASELGEGTTMVLHLPAIEPPATENRHG
jgi:PAS domain S-box-containing protein